MELMLIGKDFDLPLVAQIGLVHSHSAERIPWHCHDGFELLFLLGGAAAYEFKNSRSVEVPGEHFLVVPPKAVHRAAQDMRMPATICGVVLDPDAPRHWRNTPFTRQDLRWIVQHLQQAASTVHPFNRNLKHVVTRLAAQRKSAQAAPANPMVKATLRSLACAAILEAAQQLIAQRASGPTELVAAAAAYLRRNCHESIRMSDLVRHLGFSRARTFQLFKSGMGLTPNDYLQRVRVEKAQELLRHTRKPITDIALAAGFNSSQYFSTVFRRYTGRTPAQFRERNSP